MPSISDVYPNRENLIATFGYAGTVAFDDLLDSVAHNLHRANVFVNYRAAVFNTLDYLRQIPTEWYMCEECGRYYHELNNRGARGPGAICANCRETNEVSERSSVARDSGTVEVAASSWESAAEEVRIASPGRLTQRTQSEQRPRNRGERMPTPAIMGYGTNPLQYTRMQTFRAKPRNFDMNEGGKTFYGQRSTNGSNPPLDQTLYLGVELEVECDSDRDQSDTAAIINEAAYTASDERLFIIKTDGSLDRGLEIVTAPCSLEMLMSEHFTPLFQKFEEAEVMADRTDTCGMHVHVSHAALTPLTLGRLLVFINKTSNAAFVSEMANRQVTGNRWAATSARFDGRNAVKLLNSDGNRYSAINLGRSDTIEFRIFKGTCLRQTFLENVQFVEASVQFARDASNRALTYQDFLAWISQPSKAKRYRYLHNKLAHCGYLTSLKNNTITERRSA